MKNRNFGLPEICVILDHASKLNVEVISIMVFCGCKNNVLSSVYLCIGNDCPRCCYSKFVISFCFTGCHWMSDPVLYRPMNFTRRYKPCRSRGVCSYLKQTYQPAKVSGKTSEMLIFGTHIFLKLCSKSAQINCLSFLARSQSYQILYFNPTLSLRPINNLLTLYAKWILISFL